MVALKIKDNGTFQIMAAKVTGLPAAKKSGNETNNIMGGGNG